MGRKIFIVALATSSPSGALHSLSTQPILISPFWVGNLHRALDCSRLLCSNSKGAAAALQITASL